MTWNCFLNIKCIFKKMWFILVSWIPAEFMKMEIKDEWEGGPKARSVQGASLRLAIRNLWFDSQRASVLRGLRAFFERKTRCIDGNFMQTVLSSANAAWRLSVRLGRAGMERDHGLFFITCLVPSRRASRVLSNGPRMMCIETSFSLPWLYKWSEIWYIPSGQKYNEQF